MKRDYFIYITAFFCGMSIMAVELAASRLLSTTFSSSTPVWTVIIGLIMAFLSIGNVIGGRLADKYNSKGKLYSLIWLAGLWIAVIPLIGKYVMDLMVIALMWVFPRNLVVAGSAVSCLILFSLPLILLGIVAPYLVKLGVLSIDDNGKITGEIYAMSTIGSIIGTFIPTFLTIPVIGTSRTFFLFALILNMICLYYFIGAKTKILRTAFSAIIVAILLFAPLNDSYAFWKNNIIFEGESQYNYLQVSETRDAVMLSTNVAFGVQSIYQKNQSLTGLYYDYTLMAPFFIRNTDFNKPMKALILGMGTGTFAKQARYYFPGIKTEGVEIDPDIAGLARKYFALTNEDARVYINDGRTFLKTGDAKTYDIIMVDAYRDITFPFNMSTREFFAEVKRHLKPGGVMVVNINLHGSKHPDVADYLNQTIKSVMNKVYRCETPGGSIIVFASNDKDCLDNYRENIKELNNSPLTYISLYVDTHLTEIDQAKYVFTDDIAPVEVLGQKALDETVFNEMKYVKNQLKSSDKGIWGIFDLL
ncbi:MAG: spermidine synthase [Candidatus Saccharibacteria bacterium]